MEEELNLFSMITSIVWSQTKTPHWSGLKAKQETNKMCSNKILPSFIIPDSVSALPKVNSSRAKMDFIVFRRKERAQEEERQT